MISGGTLIWEGDLYQTGCVANGLSGHGTQIKTTSAELNTQATPAPAEQESPEPLSCGSKSR